MRGCHFQDVPGRRCLCLWGLCFDDPSDLHACDEVREQRCPHRAWDVDTRMETVRRRSLLTDRCPECGRRHDTLAEMHLCICFARLERAVRERVPALPQGTAEDLFDGAPPLVRARMRKRLRDAVIERDGCRCQDCGRDLASLPRWYTEVHHVIPRVAGGGDHPANLRTLCVECHRRYTDALAADRMLEAANRSEDRNAYLRWRRP